MSKACPLFLVFPGTSSTPLLPPPLVLEVRIVPQVPTASALPHIWTLKWVYKELGGATGHHAKACNTNLVKPQEGPAHLNPPLKAGSGGVSDPSKVAQNSIRISKSRPPSSAPPKPQEMKGGKLREEAPKATGSPPIPSQPSGQGNPGLERLTQAASSWNPESKGMRDQEMPDLPESTACPKTEPHTEKEQCPTGTLSPNNKPPFGFPVREGPQRATREATLNPFATPGKKGKEAPGPSVPPGESMEGWVFQGKKRNTPIRASPRQEPPQVPPHTP